MKTPDHWTACVTGASRGIGLAIAERLAPACSTMFIASKSKAKIQAARARLQAASRCRYHTYAGDLNKGRQVGEGLKKLVAKQAGKLDLLVLDAGFYMEGGFGGLSDRDFERYMRVNFMSAHYITTSLLPLLRKSGRARIVIIGSTAAYETSPELPTYSVTKWALRGYALNLRRVLMPEGIGVTYIAPGGTLTDMWADDEVPAGRILEPDDIAKLVAALLTLSPQACVEELVLRPVLGDYHWE